MNRVPRRPKAVCILLLFTGIAVAAQKKAGTEEGEFRIRVNGEEIGREKFVIAASEDGASSTSLLEFRTPGDERKKVQMETRLEMNARFTPTSYQLKSDVDGKKGAINGIFSPNQAMFEYIGSSTPRKSGVLVGTEFTVLDSNIFHHFIFLARLFKFGDREKVQKFEVVIPQEPDSGVLRLSETGRETIRVGRKKTETHQLQVDSGAMKMMMWVDSHRVVYRISVPSKGIEVVRE
jgi:hypothetical protein